MFKQELSEVEKRELYSIGWPMAKAFFFVLTAFIIVAIGEHMLFSRFEVAQLVLVLGLFGWG